MKRKILVEKNRFYKRVLIDPLTTKTVTEIIPDRPVKKPQDRIKRDNVPQLKPQKVEVGKEPNRIRDKSSYKNLGKIDPIFKGSSIFIVGGGPSLKDFDFTRLKDKHVIAVNKAFLFVPFADVMYWTDTRFYKWYEKEINLFSGLKVTNKSTPIKPGIVNLQDTGREGLETRPDGIRHGNNSGYAAINLAYLLGANKIILLGFDMKIEGKKTHFHDGYSTPQNPKIYENNMVPYFKTLVDPLKSHGVEIYNACPDSALTCFKKCTIEEVMRF